MLDGNNVRSILSKTQSKKEQMADACVSELHALYDIRSKIEDKLSKMIVDHINKRPDSNGIAFYDMELGDEYNQYKAKLTRLPLEIIADHICNWLVLNNYYAKFRYYQSTNTVQFVIKWFDSNLYPRPEKEN